MTGTAIRATGLRKSYGENLVLDGIDLEVATGTVFALLGPNGAGKTTTVHMLTTMLTPDSGEVEVGGHDLRTDPEGVRAEIGVTGQFSAVDNLLTGQENLQLMADLNHLPRDEGRRRIADLLDRFDLVEVAGRMVATYSGGEKRRLDLAMTLVGDPRIVFLDEPTTGLDPRGRRTMWDIVRGLVADGITIFLTTQYLEEADELAGRIALLDEGHLVAQGTPAELKRLVPGGHIRLEFGDPAQLERAAERLATRAAIRMPSRSTSRPMARSPRCGRCLIGSRPRRSKSPGVTLHTPDLDDVFLSLTGKNSPRKVATE